MVDNVALLYLQYPHILIFSYTVLLKDSNAGEEELGALEAKAGADTSLAAEAAGRVELRTTNSARTLPRNKTLPFVS